MNLNVWLGLALWFFLISGPGSATTVTHILGEEDESLLVTVTGSGETVLAPTAAPVLLSGGRVEYTVSGITNYAWDVPGRLARVTLPSGQVHSYDYDYRTRRIGTHQSAQGEQGAKHTAILFSGGLSLAEYESPTAQTTLSSPGGSTVRYVRGPDMGGGVGGLLYSTRGGTSKYNLSNGRGDIVAQSDASATLTWTASYEAYGKRTKETGVNADKQRANSKDEDPTGLLNEGFRYRDIETGSWLSRDPAGFVDGPNLYAYVQQNPWTSFDPDGLRACGGPIPARKTPPSSAEKIIMGAYGAMLSIPSGPALLIATPERTVSAIATQAKADYKDGGVLGVFNRYNPVASIVGGVAGFDPVNGSPLDLQERSQSITGGLLGLYGTTQAGVALRNNVARSRVPLAPVTTGARLTLQEAELLAISTCDDIAKNLAKLEKTPTVTSVTVDSATGNRYAATSLGNKLSAQPTKIAEALQKALPAESLESWMITNCAEFNSVNNALLKGGQTKDLVVRTVSTATQQSKEACKNCSNWLEKLNIKVVK